MKTNIEKQSEFIITLVDFLNKNIITHEKKRVSSDYCHHWGIGNGRGISKTEIKSDIKRIRRELIILDSLFKN